MMKYNKLLAVLFLSIAAIFATQGQDFGNQWVNANQTYFKIQLKANGIHRITYQELLDAGFPVNTVDPRRLQLWFRGEQRAIVIEGEADGTLDEGDYIEFYGQENDGTQDAPMYDDPIHMPNPYRSLYSDRTSYFLTYTLDGSFGKRMPLFYESNTSITPIDYYFDEFIGKPEFIQNGPVYPSYLTYGSRGVFVSTLTSATGVTHFVAGTTGQTENIGSYAALPKSYLPIQGINLRFSWHLYGWSNGPHKFNVSIGPSIDKLRVIKELECNNFETRRIENIEVPSSDFPKGGQQFVMRLRAEDATPDIAQEVVASGYFAAQYPVSPDLSGRDLVDLTLPNTSTSKSRMLLQNPPSGARVFDLTNPNDMRIIGADLINGELSAVIDQTQQQRTVLITSETKVVDSIEPVTFSPIPANINYLIISHKDLMTPAGGYDNPVASYAEYRASAAGGSHKVWVADIDELFNYFTYGEPTPLAIRKCIQYLQSQGNTIENLFIIGKGLEATTEYYKKLPASKSWGVRSLVPCMGMPCSDVLLTANLNGNTQDVSTIPTGRLAAIIPSDIAAYLDKVKDHETQVYNSLSRKNTLFLSGGYTNYERRVFRNYMEEFARLTENTHLGGKSELYAKETTSAVEIFDVSKELNEGLNLLMLFGHSSSTSTDIDISIPQSSTFNYENKGKYPLLIINGCNSGDIFQLGRSIGEFWLIAENKGAIAYLAHSDLGYPQQLRFHSLLVLRELYGDSTTIHRPIGQSLIRAQQKLIDTWPDNPLAISQLHQYTFQGDPAIRIFPVDKPDYHISDNSLFVQSIDDEQIVTADADKFQIAIDVSNFGITKEDSITVRVKRIFNNGINGEKWYPSQSFERVYYRDTLYYTIEVSEEDKQKAVGINTFEVYLDQENKIAEMNENNNQGRFDYVFPRSAIRLLAPQNYGIVASQPVLLNAQNLDMLPTKRDYIFQLDTTDNFNSPFFKEQIVNASFNPSWSITELLSNNQQDSTVYYWRVKFASVGELDAPNWENGSFTYIKDSPSGWMQSHFPQFKKADLVDVQEITTNAKWAFATDTIKVSMKTTGAAGTWSDQFIKYNDLPITEAGGCGGSNMLMLLSIDYETGIPYNRMEFQDYFSTCGVMGATRAITRVINPNYLANMTNNFLDSGDYIFLMSSRSIPLGNLRNADMLAMERMGIPIGTLGNKVRSGEPFIAMGRLDVPGFEAIIYTADPAIADSIPLNKQEAFGEFILPIRKRFGTVTSTPVGPASSWTNTSHHFGPADNSTDQVVVDLIGVSPTGTEDVLMRDISSSSTDLAGIDPNAYPYLRLKASFRDPKDATPQILENWHIGYKGLPEGLISFDGTTANFEETLSFGEGEDATLFFKFENISDVDFQSPIVFQYTLKKPDNTISTAYDTLATLPAGSSINYSKTFNTLGIAGNSELTVFANPLSQKEQLYDNNVLQRAFEVRPDQINPVLDITFDGVHIMDGDIVSPNPIISIALTDENPYYTLSDTASLALYLSAVNTTEFTEIATEGNPAVKWVEEGDNALRIEYSPEKLEDGKYQLRVQARDASGNTAGAKPYEVNFEVINASQITHFYPYPNPFSTNVRFVFTLTGDKLPDNMRIQIMTVTGKVVREITQEELGPIHIGNNITQYAWDGKDEYGDQLANGTYLYRVIADYDGQAIERRTTSGDNLFKNNIGKMYLLK